MDTCFTTRGNFLLQGLKTWTSKLNIFFLFEAANLLFFQSYVKSTLSDLFSNQKTFVFFSSFISLTKNTTVHGSDCEIHLGHNLFVSYNSEHLHKSAIINHVSCCCDKAWLKYRAVKIITDSSLLSINTTSMSCPLWQRSAGHSIISSALFFTFFWCRFKHTTLISPPKAAQNDFIPYRYSKLPVLFMLIVYIYVVFYNFSKAVRWRWILAPGGLGVQCNQVLGHSLGLAARCWSTSTVRLLCPHSTHIGLSWWQILPHRTGTGLVSTVKKKKANFILINSHHPLFTQFNLLLCKWQQKTRLAH